MIAIADSDRVNERVSLLSTLNRLVHFQAARSVFTVGQQDHRTAGVFSRVCHQIVGARPNSIPDRGRTRACCISVRDGWRRLGAAWTNDYIAADVSGWRNKFHAVNRST
jgi:hypothetical protein